MEKALLYSGELNDYFIGRDYNYVRPYSIVNNKDTVFITSGIQPILRDYREGKLENEKKIYVPQPVIRTKTLDRVEEGMSVAFVNPTLASFNISEEEYRRTVNDFIDLLREKGLSKDNIGMRDKDYERVWGDLLVSGKKTFYYYNDIELGDSTFFTSVTKDGKKIGIDTMSDLGFGLERLRWCVNNDSYFNLYSDKTDLCDEVKVYLSALALLAVNDVYPSNKNTGYRTRMFSKKLVDILDGHLLSKVQEEYLLECIDYWKDWQNREDDVDILMIENEYIRNSNRYIINQLISEGYPDLARIVINVPRDEFKKRLLSANVPKSRVSKI